ncbi:alanine racemase [Clostridium botulinum]|uniref:Alanine racemase n=2 Tax=Clostridium botulinum TaxID=1491 RepID=A0A846I8S5_CLOBO|nr:alanine racemase [Clostridium botulinum]ACQ54481.1 alanine racemase [Clostridium botulinum Ba4 str. 657]AJE11327.1 alanine racemase [Clostridium botulinum CDC_1436]EDT84182.1 alanine racemase [Clostridium botulinum Bf]MBY6880955.1 alanine racemase [Clostridium botulinum]NEZ88036.1 alanine racemase [Clostridium botulinum]
MFRNHRPVWEEVNLDNLSYNMRNIKKKVNCKEIFAVVKANGYGHGALDIASTLLENGATRHSVACLSEAIELREGGITCPINILGITPPTLFEDIINYNIEPVVFSYDYANQLSKAASLKNRIVKTHIAVDTGMGRLGFDPTVESLEEIKRIQNLSNIKIEGLCSHFSSSDEKDKSYSEYQFKIFQNFRKKLIEMNMKIPIHHMSNSAAIIDLPSTYLDAVRAGIILYGYYPSREVNKENLHIKQVMTLKANIVHIKTIDSGKYVGYNRKFKTKRKSKIAILPLGYGDGYTRFLSNRGKVIINGQYAPIVGNICMDQCMIDVTDIKEVKVGDEVIIIGRDDINNLRYDAEDIASKVGMTSGEIMSIISKRVPRVYIKNGNIVKVKNYIA